MRKCHHLKCESKYYQAIERGFKKFEVRLNDRNFRVHNLVYLHETINGEYTGNTLPPLEIQYVLRGGKFGIEENYCIFCW